MQPHVCSCTERIRFGAVVPERLEPFGSAFTDCGMAVLRCNNEYRSMGKGFPDSSTLDGFPGTCHYTATVCRGGMPFLCDDARVSARRDLSAQSWSNAYIIFLARSRAPAANAQPLAGNVSTVAARCDGPHRAARGIVSGAGSAPATMSMPPELPQEDNQGGCQKEDNDKYAVTPHGKATRE